MDNVLFSSILKPSTEKWLKSSSRRSLDAYLYDSPFPAVLIMCSVSLLRNIEINPGFVYRVQKILILFLFSLLFFIFWYSYVPLIFLLQMIFAPFNFLFSILSILWYYCFIADVIHFRDFWCWPLEVIVVISKCCGITILIVFLFILVLDILHACCVRIELVPYGN